MVGFISELKVSYNQCPQFVYIFSNNPWFILVKSSIRLKFHPQDPSIANDFPMWERWHKLSSVIYYKVSKLLMHSIHPFFMLKGCLSGSRLKQNNRCKQIIRLRNTIFWMCVHGRIIRGEMCWHRGQGTKVNSKENAIGFKHMLKINWRWSWNQRR